MAPRVMFRGNLGGPVRPASGVGPGGADGADARVWLRGDVAVFARRRVTGDWYGGPGAETVTWTATAVDLARGGHHGPAPLRVVGLHRGLVVAERGEATGRVALIEPATGATRGEVPLPSAMACGADDDALVALRWRAGALPALVTIDPATSRESTLHVDISDPPTALMLAPGHLLFRDGGFYTLCDRGVGRRLWRGRGAAAALHPSGVAVVAGATLDGIGGDGVFRFRRPEAALAVWSGDGAIVVELAGPSPYAHLDVTTGDLTPLPAPLGDVVAPVRDGAWIARGAVLTRHAADGAALTTVDVGGPVAALVAGARHVAGVGRDGGVFVVAI